MILITGATGQLGRALVAEARLRQLEILAVSRPEFDLAAPATIDACFAQAKPDLVINAAAYTAVDAAETDREAAQAGNHTGPEHMARLCAAHDIPFIHVSTDYVFDGTKGAPYVETDPTHPTGVYGLTKRDGENAVLATGAKVIILRTAWVYAPYGKNFLRTMLKAAQRMPVLRVVADQHGTPTSAPDLAVAILTIAEKIRAEGWQASFAGIFHATNAGATTWHGFASAIFEEAQSLGHPRPRIDAITTADWPTPAKRPADSRLDGAKLQRVFGCALPPWREGLKDVLERGVE